VVYLLGIKLKKQGTDNIFVHEDSFSQKYKLPHPKDPIPL